MDALTLARAKKVAQTLVDAVSGDVGNLSDTVEQLANDLASLVTDADIINRDGDLASALILNRLRQHLWQFEDFLICEIGSAVLTNSLTFPFNNSKKSVSLVNRQKDINYGVMAWTDSEAGNIGDIQVTDKQVNGFKVAYSGSAKTATIKYIVIGGLFK